ncbi:hypothetical protein PS623_03979 [Pseudomonas fluorescens]|nr:hypothetical protein PS623_03979 [Pseudomonas fluorescens]
MSKLRQQTAPMGQALLAQLLLGKLLLPSGVVGILQGIEFRQCLALAKRRQFISQQAQAGPVKAGQRRGEQHLLSPTHCH